MPCSLSRHCPSPPPPSPQPWATTDLLSVFILPNFGFTCLPLLEISCKWNSTLCYLLCLASSFSIMFLRFTHVQYLFLSYGWIIPHYMGLPWCIHLFTHWWTFESFLPFGLKSVLRWAFVTKYWIPVFNFGGHILRSRIAESYGNSMLNFSRTYPLCPTVAAPFSIPLSSGQGFSFQFLHILTNTCYFFHFFP